MHTCTCSWTHWMNNHFLLTADITWLSSGSVMTPFESIVRLKGYTQDDVTSSLLCIHVRATEHTDWIITSCSMLTLLGYQVVQSWPRLKALFRLKGYTQDDVASSLLCIHVRATEHTDWIITSCSMLTLFGYQVVQSWPSLKALFINTQVAVACSETRQIWKLPM